MGKITSAQRAALEAAGYTISKSGNTVIGKKGGTVGGYNEKGNIFSGSKEVTDILKSNAAAPTSSSKPKARPAKSSPAKKPAGKPTAPDAMAGYRKGDVTTSPIPKIAVTITSGVGAKAENTKTKPRDKTFMEKLGFGFGTLLQAKPTGKTTRQSNPRGAGGYAKGGMVKGKK